MSKPRMDVTIMIPTKMKEMCWDQNFTWGGEKRTKEIWKTEQLKETEADSF